MCSLFHLIAFLLSSAPGKGPSRFPLLCAHQNTHTKTTSLPTHKADFALNPSFTSPHLKGQAIQKAEFNGKGAKRTTPRMKVRSTTRTESYLEGQCFGLELLGELYIQPLHYPSLYDICKQHVHRIKYREIFFNTDECLNCCAWFEFLVEHRNS